METGEDMEPQRPAASTAKKRRSRFGCTTCRTRKVKCDERPSGCLNCEKLHLECTYSRPTGQPTRSQTGRRTYRSCNACRAARCKCSGDRPLCARCQETDLPCSYADTGAGTSRNGLSQTKGTRVTTTSPDKSSEAGTSMRQGSLPASSSVVSGPSETQLPCYVYTPLPTCCEPALLTAGSRLNSRELPEPKHIRVLVNHYFQNFHHLRCFAFLHKPTFLRKLDDGISANLQDNALLHIICTLGAQFYALEHSDTVQSLPSDFILHAGHHWAKTAERLVLGNINHISIEGLMVSLLVFHCSKYMIPDRQTAQLLYDYALRMANFTQAFILSALMARMTQALQINLEYSSDILNQSPRTSLSVTIRECRRRLMWSCYTTDVLCGSGVDQLTLIREKDLSIQLPCNDWSFLHERPRITRTLSGHPLAFVHADLVPSDLDENMGLVGYFVQQMEIRRRVLWYIKHLDQAKPPWQPDSEFALLDRELQAWYESLPSTLAFTAEAIYMRRESSQLGALCVFHCAYHQTMCDLYRIGTPALYKLRSAFTFPPDMGHFQSKLQFALFKEARTLAAIIAEAERHGPRTLADTWLPTIAYDSNRIMLIYLTQVNEPAGMSKRDLVLSTIPYLQSNLKALRTLRATNAVADDLSRAAESMLEALGVDSNSILPLPNVILNDPYLALLSRNQHGSMPGTPPQSAPDYVLNPLSIFRMARHSIPEGHAPENAPVAAARGSRTLPAGDPELEMSSMQHQDMYESMEGFGHNLDMFFAPPDSTLDWQSADMIVGNGVDNTGGLLPWAGHLDMGDFMLEPPGDGVR
ncbi:uncharacterized protein F5Z01DRAFT_473842 [Emericellopsis atlantica]|uniref:Zn(2)-C6 fungal-type domain-containing protein n=1 Tax=Emericellopsis atlantica TaxID=2614577 RepID=A0A9P8CLH6_9HYPO|nr:uncharacterized protein F5Z01DRAFT_473842 [Emericellopsis atlantica]KAG9249616.1 hypothetical protein F5Z01DRAFT_473842 [Emericellopsis atlantica]